MLDRKTQRGFEGMSEKKKTERASEGVNETVRKR